MTGWARRAVGAIAVAGGVLSAGVVLAEAVTVKGKYLANETTYIPP